MDLTHAERLKAVVRWLTAALGITQQELGKLCGYENGAYFSQLLNGKKQIAASLDDKVASLHPDLDVEVLRGNSDNMFLPGPGPVLKTFPAEPKAPVKRETGLYVPHELVQMFTDLSATVRSQQDTIRLLVEKVSNN